MDIRTKYSVGDRCCLMENHVAAVGAVVGVSVGINEFGKQTVQYTVLYKHPYTSTVDMYATVSEEDMYSSAESMVEAIKKMLNNSNPR